MLQGYTAYDTGGCSSHNELGVDYIELDECKALCDDDPACISFVYSKTGTYCSRSSTCTHALSAMNADNPNRLYVKNLGERPLSLSLLLVSLSSTNRARIRTPLTACSCDAVVTYSLHMCCTHDVRSLGLLQL